jgi:hypothetical protein
VEPQGSDSTKGEHEAVYVDHLERRRSDFDRSMWQAPALTIAAQAFLLRVLTDRSIGGGARAVILGAGVLASVAAIASLLRLRAREVRYSEHIARSLGRQEGDPWLRKPEPKLKERPPLLSERRLRQWAGRWRPPVYLLWCVALVAFGVADVVALLATR